MACPPTFELETAESHPDSALITGEWLLPTVAVTLGGGIANSATQYDHRNPDAGINPSLSPFFPPLPDPLPDFYVWVPQSYALVLGASQTLEREMNADAWLKSHAGPSAEIPVRLCKRRGGGGAVLLGEHSLCIAMRSPRRDGQGPLDYFKRFNSLVAEAVAQVTGITLAPMGISDLARGDRKVVGSSLYLSREWALYLASVLIAPPAPLFDTLLKHPSREPDYRQGRSHRDFITDLTTLLGNGNSKGARVTHPSDWVTGFAHHLSGLLGKNKPL